MASTLLREPPILPSNPSLYQWLYDLWLKRGNTQDHSQLSNLDFNTAGHSNFQKKMIYDSQLGLYWAES